jgi:peptidoglycan hydrolase CwlO-like protein
MTAAEQIDALIRKETERQTHLLRQRVRKLEAQRDQANGRCKELREHVTRYQKTIADLREQLREETNR